MKIFSGSASVPLAKRIAKAFKIELSPLEIHAFPDNEKRIRVIDKVVGENCIVLQSTAKDADKNYMELFFIVDALKRSGAGSITAVIPYLGYQRQDHLFRTGEAVSIEVIARILKMLGVSKIISFDLHSIKIPEIFKVHFTHLSALSIFKDKIKKMNLDSRDIVLVSPDMGGIRRIKILSYMLNNMPFITIEKNRDLTTGKISMKKIEGVVRKKAIIVDDLISTGATIVKAAKLLKEKGGEKIYVFATHPVFSSDAAKMLQESSIDKVFVTDTISAPKEKQFSKLTILSVAEMIAEVIRDQEPTHNK